MRILFDSGRGIKSLFLSSYMVVRTCQERFLLVLSSFNVKTENFTNKTRFWWRRQSLPKTYRYNN